MAHYHHDKAHYRKDQDDDYDNDKMQSGHHRARCSSDDKRGHSKMDDRKARAIKDKTTNTPHDYFADIHILDTGSILDFLPVPESTHAVKHRSQPLLQPPSVPYTVKHRVSHESYLVPSRPRQKHTSHISRLNLSRLPDKILSRIFSFTSDPASFSLVCRRFQSVSKSPHARAGFFLFLYGTRNAIPAALLGPFHAACYLAVLDLLLRQCPLPRWIVQLAAIDRDIRRVEKHAARKVVRRDPLWTTAWTSGTVDRLVQKGKEQYGHEAISGRDWMDMQDVLEEARVGTLLPREFERLKTLIVDAHYTAWSVIDGTRPDPPSSVSFASLTSSTSSSSSDYFPTLVNYHPPTDTILRSLPISFINILYRPDILTLHDLAPSLLRRLTTPQTEETINTIVMTERVMKGSLVEVQRLLKSGYRVSERVVDRVRVWLQADRRLDEDGRRRVRRILKAVTGTPYGEV
ncbi:uncharacterized protein SPPG_02936 [Spizellomyces punctatus DAOM BR117]|uniref:F-box domain-containing protein n=1 Tax=Spizellomyces punctatus (strain DAOM BR117) TaxID=645134 RepID=A0A0L0HNE6_SPIPD|nr:uncharacterized protein SPPG_02936 [Spizellomyces punctatus DAOM BR117]KND02475.1 hypothetical protein SPPG_02936 [Spizellomyces punctatus DAOM BR117]|eukprot:XP_016610514.1 hypothetical protein SPPG_02936 [Spizellomyces punctatus DAOM BR117]